MEDSPSPRTPLSPSQPRLIFWRLFDPNAPSPTSNPDTNLSPPSPTIPLVSLVAHESEESEEEGEVDEVVMLEELSDDLIEEEGEDEEPPIPPETIAVMSTLRQNWPFFGARIRLWQYWKRVMARKDLFLSFLSEETDYRSRLDTLYTIYVEPLQTMNSASPPHQRLVSQGDYAQFFGGLRAIRLLTIGFHDSLTQALHPVVRNDRVYQRFGRAGDEFLAVAPFFRMYKTFVAKYPRSLARLRALRTGNEEFSRVLGEMKYSSDTSMGIEGLLEVPCRRCVRYYEFLGEALALTDDVHPDHAKLLQAQSQLEEVAVWVRDRLEEYEDEERFEPIRRRFENWESQVTSTFRGRRIIREGTFFQSTHRTTPTLYHVHLFSDTLLFSTVTPSNTYVICFVISLIGIRILTTEEAPHQTSLKLNSWVFILDSENERNDWARAIYDEAVKINLRMPASVSSDIEEEEEEDTSYRNLTPEECIAICQDLSQPTTMLKLFSSRSILRRRPHHRRFSISQDRSTIHWGGPRHQTMDSSVNLAEVVDVVLGQHTPAFRQERANRARRNASSAAWDETRRLSFSLLYGVDSFDENGEWTGRSLDLICESVRDHYVWTTALRHICGSPRAIKVDRHNMTPTTTAPARAFPIMVKNDPEVTECRGCGRRFTTFRRRHRCRRCGGVFCNRCSRHRVSLPDMGVDDHPVRVCNWCFRELQ